MGNKAYTKGTRQLPAVTKSTQQSAVPCWGTELNKQLSGGTRACAAHGAPSSPRGYCFTLLMCCHFTFSSFHSSASKRGKKHSQNRTGKHLEHALSIWNRDPFRSQAWIKSHSCSHLRLIFSWIPNSWDISYQSHRSPCCFTRQVTVDLKKTCPIFQSTAMPGDPCPLFCVCLLPIPFHLTAGWIGGRHRSQPIFSGAVVN